MLCITKGVFLSGDYGHIVKQLSIPARDFQRHQVGSKHCLYTLHLQGFDCLDQAGAQCKLVSATSGCWQQTGYSVMDVLILA